MAGEESFDGLERLAWQRARLADRVRTPGWYLAGFGLMMALFFAAPFGTHYLHWAGGVAILLSLAVFFLLQAGLARASGLAIGTRTLRYPSGRVAGSVLMVVSVGAFAAETILLRDSLSGDAVAVGILAVAVAVTCWRAHVRGIGRDLRAGIGPQ